MVLLLWMVFGVFAIVAMNFSQTAFTPWLAVIPAFFSLFAFATFKRVTLNPQVKLSVIMATKMLRLLLSLVCIFLYVFIVADNILVFVVSFGAFFLLYLGVETWIMVQLNKKSKS